ncbi:MAG: Phage terminase large subunit (GpA) [Syntrophorhabdus sp. PtaU1.Bin153]|nr:MAG: Phage terminase large subunit (GpA) [Syntrophorhabdus sp. PtaU1.Bin153]
MASSLAIAWWPEEIAAWQEVEDLTVSEWADRYRILTYKAAKNGPWETSYNPVIRRIQDAFGLDWIEEITVVAPTQSGKSEALLNAVGYWVTQDPGPVLIVEPNEDLASELSTDRVDDMIGHCDLLVAQLSDNASDTTKKKKTFKAMTVYFGWAGSPTSLASRPCRRVLFDEVDKYNKWTGEEASPLKLGKERTNTFIDSGRCIGYLSTPTTEQGYITKQETQADARFRYLITCPRCGYKQQWKFPQIKFGEDHTLAAVENSSWYECESCHGRITEDERMELNRRGEWHEIASMLPFLDHITKFRPKSVSFQFNRICTPWFSFGAIAAEFLRSKDIPENLMNFKNSWLAEPWVEEIESKKEEELALNRIEIPPLVCPKGTLALTCGVDPGQGGFWYSVVSWDTSYSPHLVQHGFLLDFDAVRRLWFENVYQVQGLSYPIRIWRKGMDTGGSQYGDSGETMTASAYGFLRDYNDGSTFGTKGNENMRSATNMQISMIDRMPGPNGKSIPGGLGVWIIKPSYFKTLIHMRLNVKAGDPGRFTFNSSVGSGSDYIKHLRGEVKRHNRKSGRWEWVAVGANHLFDATVIAFAMADPECFGGVRVLAPLPKEDIPADAKHVDEDRKEGDSGWITGNSRKGGWI